MAGAEGFNELELPDPGAVDSIPKSTLPYQFAKKHRVAIDGEGQSVSTVPTKIGEDQKTWRQITCVHRLLHQLDQSLRANFTAWVALPRVIFGGVKPLRKMTSEEINDGSTEAREVRPRGTIDPYKAPQAQSWREKREPPNLARRKFSQLAPGQNFGFR